MIILALVFFVIMAVFHRYAKTQENPQRIFYQLVAGFIGALSVLCWVLFILDQLNK